jgi:hypothetical protein
MYILIFEDGSIGKTEKISESEIESCNDGILDIIDIENMTTLNGDDWVAIESV